MVRKSLLALTAIISLVTALLAAVLQSAPASAMPMSATDESKVPHYFGPYSNWANSPQVMTNAVVTLSGGGGTGATASATVDPKTGGISKIDVTSPGTGYTAPPAVTIDSPGIAPVSPASATAAISPGVVKSFSVTENGFGFTQPVVTVSGGNPTAPAAGQASGGVDNVTLVDGGSGYSVKPIVEFSMPDLPTGTRATGVATMDVSGIVTSVDVLNPGSGYTQAPTVTILDGTSPNPNAATATATINVTAIAVTDGGQGYDSAPTVTVLDKDGTDHNASATATVAAKGAVTDITVTAAGAGYLTPGIRKFVDTLPGLGTGGANNLGEYIPVAQPDTTTYPGTDYYEIAVVQYRHKFSSDLPPTLVRGYVQLATSVVPGKHLPLSNANLDPNLPDSPIDGYAAVDQPSYLGPTILAQKDRPVRILFRNLLPTGTGGDLFLPVDTTLMGSGAGPNMMKLDANGVPMDMAADEGSVLDGVRNPMCGETPKPADCYSENRATLHLHGGITPWISDGTPHQWTTPAGENTDYPKGVSVSNVPDMPDPGPGAETFFYTNQQSARLMFYHDHAWGITRLNVYAGEAAGYLITDKMEQQLTAPGGALDGLGYGTPLIIQDKTFVPSNVHDTDPTWDSSRWGSTGSLWAPHVYMPAQNPDDPSGVSPFGRWMYGPYFWPPNNPKYPPIDNPYYNPSCNIDDSTTWQYQDYPYCEPKTIPGTPNVSVGMEAFNDTPVVNGVAYPTTTVDPKAYRFRILNAANDRFWNLQWYVADPTTGTLSEVALKQNELDAAQTDPNVFPTPDTTKSPVGPDWVQIGTEGGFLPTPAVIHNQPTTWITDPTRFDFGNVDQHALLLAPAERADTIVDFSQFRGKTLILYNDAPAAFPARQANQDYYTGDPDMRPAGAPSTLPGYGPNTRTIMQIKVSNATPAAAWDRPNTTNDRMGQLMAAFAHHTDATGKPAGVFEAGSDPIVVGQNAYNTAYGTSFAASGYCGGTKPSAKCDGYARIQQQGGQNFTFDTLSGNQLSIPIQPKALHDEMNSTNQDEFGRMTANMGVEVTGASPINQNIVLYPYVNPTTENLDVSTDTSVGLSGGRDGLEVQPISTNVDGTQIWKITHNGVDTHPIHFHLFDVQILNRVTWDNIILPPDPNELGWKDTIRVSPLEDTIVAVRPIEPKLPFGVPDSVRPLNPMMPLGAVGDPNGTGLEAGFNSTDVNGNPMVTPIKNEETDFGWEYVWHCHILSHEEMDMMRPMMLHVPNVIPDAPGNLAQTPATHKITWTDGTPVDYTDPTTWGSPKSEIGYKVERSDVTDGTTVTGNWQQIGTALANATSYDDAAADPTQWYAYRVTAWNQAGSATSDVVIVPAGPNAPSGLTATVQPAPALPSGSRVALSWTNNATGPVDSFVVQRAVGGGAWADLATVPGTTTGYLDTSVLPGSYQYRVKAFSTALGSSAWAGPATADVPFAQSQTVVVSSANPSVAGQSVTISAKVVGVGAAAVPTGSLTFSIDGSPVTTVTLDQTGVARYTTSSLSVGQHPVTADYAGDTIYAPSTGSDNQTVNLAGTTTALFSDHNPSTDGQLVTFTATVSPAGATGTVDFVVDGTLMATRSLTAGAATWSSSTLSVGSHTVSAVYSGDAMNATSTSVNLVQVVGPRLRATGTTLTSSANPSTFGQTVTYTATVRPGTGTGTPTGSVQFTVDGVVVATAVLNNQGQAVYATNSLGGGTHTVVASYTGSTTFAGSTSGVLTQTVRRAGTTTTVTSNLASSVYGQAVTFTATVAPATATGTVSFTVDGVVTGAPVTLDATGRARLTISTLAAGRHTITARYAGSADYNASTSAAISRTVNKANTTSTVTSSALSITFGSTVVFTATVKPVAPGGGIPAGTVRFRIDGRYVGTSVTLNASGKAAYSTLTLARGSHTVAVVYAGNANYNGSTSPNITQVIR